MKPSPDDVLIRDGEVVATPLQLGGVDLFVPRGGFYHPITELWEGIGEHCRQLQNERASKSKEHWRDEKAAIVGGDEGALMRFNLASAKKLQGYLQQLSSADEPFVPANSPVDVGMFLTASATACSICDAGMVTWLTRSNEPVCSTRCQAALIDRRADRYRAYKRDQMRQRRATDRTRACDVCGERFTPKRNDAVSCSVKCRQRKAYQRSK